MQVLAKGFPQDVTYDTPFDTTKFVSESINEVYKTLIEAGLLVLVVILIFLQDWRAMLVPATTVPVTIIGALRRWPRSASPSISRRCLRSCSRSASWLDDAIVVVEGAAHNIEKGMFGHDAAISAMDALFAPIIGITLVLISVFLPSAFPAGIDRADVCAVRAGDCRNRAAQRHQRGDAEADAVRVVAAPARAAGAATFLSRFQRGL